MKYYFTNGTAERVRAREVQLLIEKATGLVLANPFYNHAGTPTKEIQQLDKGLPTDVSPAEIVENDKKMIRESAGIIAYITDKASFGSAMEIFYAHDVLGKPVYTICLSEKLRRHPWLRQYSNEVFDCVDSFLKFAYKRLVANVGQAKTSTPSN